MVDSYEDEGEIEIPIDGILDLHPFSPKDLKFLIPDYIEECRTRDILEIRFIHGKGVGNIRRSVHALLERNNSVKTYKLASEEAGSWGATIAILFPR